jgi:AhpD family alkylhydroperoxidase
MHDWNTYRDALLERVGDYARQSPDVVRGLMTIDGAAARTGHLTPRMHELIALAVAVTTRCDGCIAVHTQKAVEHGATLEEISEALGVAIALNAGAALTYSARVLEAHAQLPGK